MYAEAKINPAEVSYVEAHGTGTKAGDPEELNSLTNVFCNGRAPEMGPLLIGSVKSNMGHPEPASGLCGVTKVLLAMQHGVIPPNLHFNTPNPDIPALLDGRLKVRSLTHFITNLVNMVEPHLSNIVGTFWPKHTLLELFSLLEHLTTAATISVLTLEDLFADWRVGIGSTCAIIFSFCQSPERNEGRVISIPWLEIVHLA